MSYWTLYLLMGSGSFALISIGIFIWVIIISELSNNDDKDD